MARVENGQLNINAGLDLIQELRKNGYQQKIMVYASTKRHNETSQKVASVEVQPVEVTCNEHEALNFCCFK